MAPLLEENGAWFGIATLHGFRVIGTVLVIRFRFRQGDHSAGRRSLFDRGLDFYCGGIGLE